jgi:ribosome-associated protein
MPENLHVTRSLMIPAAELHERFSRSSGPGGQGVNTADSRVELSFDVAGSPSIPDWLRPRILDRLAGRLVDGVLTIAASEHRAQLANRAAARDRLADLLRAAAAPPAPAFHQTVPGLPGTPAGRQTSTRDRQTQPPLRPGRLKVTEFRLRSAPMDFFRMRIDARAVVAAVLYGPDPR